MVSHRKFMTKCWNKSIISYWSVPIVIIPEPQYTSQCSPFAPSVSKEYADKKKRVKRGLYKEGNAVFNADAVGAFNILRKYLKENEKEIVFPVKGISDPIVIKAAV